MEKCEEWGKDLWLVAVHFEKAFDSIEHDAVWEALRQGVLRQSRLVSYQEACKQGLDPDIQAWISKHDDSWLYAANRPEEVLAEGGSQLELAMQRFLRSGLGRAVAAAEGADWHALKKVIEDSFQDDDASGQASALTIVISLTTLRHEVGAGRTEILKRSADFMITVCGSLEKPAGWDCRLLPVVWIRACRRAGVVCAERCRAMPPHPCGKVDGRTTTAMGANRERPEPQGRRGGVLLSREILGMDLCGLRR